MRLINGGCRHPRIQAPQSAEIAFFAARQRSARSRSPRIPSPALSPRIWRSRRGPRAGVRRERTISCRFVPSCSTGLYSTVNLISEPAIAGTLWIQLCSLRFHAPTYVPLPLTDDIHTQIARRFEQTELPVWMECSRSYAASSAAILPCSRFAMTFQRSISAEGLDRNH